MIVAQRLNGRQLPGLPVTGAYGHLEDPNLSLVRGSPNLQSEELVTVPLNIFGGVATVLNFDLGLGPGVVVPTTYVGGDVIRPIRPPCFKLHINTKDMDPIPILGGWSFPYLEVALTYRYMAQARVLSRRFDFQSLRRGARVYIGVPYNEALLLPGSGAILTLTPVGYPDATLWHTALLSVIALDQDTTMARMMDLQ